MRAVLVKAFSIVAPAIAICLSGITESRADDTEIFVATPAASANTKPNILFVIDTSGSMSTKITTQTTYDPSQTYPGAKSACPADRVYWSTSGTAPNCATSGNWVDASVF